MTATTAPTTYAIGDAVVIFRDGFEGTRKLFVDDIVDDGETVEYTLRHDYGLDYIGFFKAEELKPYEGSDLQWKREGKAMYAALKAENERLKAELDGCEDTLANAVIDHAAPSVTVHEQALDTAPIPNGTRVYMTYGNVTYRAEIVGYEAARDRYEVRYYCPQRKTIMQGVCVAPSTLTVAEPEWQRTDAQQQGAVA